MAEIDISTLRESVEVMKNIKELISPKDPYLPVYSALGGAFVGAVASIIPAGIIGWIRVRRKRKSVTLAIYSEIKANLELYEHRGYVEHIKSIIKRLKEESKDGDTLTIHMSEERFPVYRSQVSAIGTLDPDVARLAVRFYQLVEAVTQDVKPGGMSNNRKRSIGHFEELLMIAGEAVETGTELVAVVEKRYST